MKVRYLGVGHEVQATWASCKDPRPFLKIGKTYEVNRMEEHTWHTKVFLKDFPDRPFNSVLFEREGE